MVKTESLNRLESELRKLLRKINFSLYPQRVTSVEALKDSLLEIRNQGYALDDEELLAGVRCIATSIKNYSGRVIGAISISGPSIWTSYEKLTTS